MPPSSTGTTATVAGVSAPVRYIDQYHIELTIPPKPSSVPINTPVDIVITNPDNTSQTSQNSYTYYTTPTPQITSISPNTTHIYGGEEITITGTNLDNMRWKQVSVGHDHTCALASNNKVYCWGYNGYGQLGTGNTTNQSTPVEVLQGAIPSGVNITQISLGYDYTCALASNNKVYCWGYNGYDQLGNGNTTNQSTPVAVSQGAIPPGVNITQISAGKGHNCALANNKTYCWGYNGYGQLGTGNTTNQSTPTEVLQGAIPSGTHITQIQVGFSHTCALASNNKAYCWGSNGDGQLGNNSTQNRYTMSPVLIKSTPNISFGNPSDPSSMLATNISINVPSGKYYTNTLTLTTPSHPVGQVPIIVTNPDGQSSSTTMSSGNTHTFYSTANPPTNLTTTPTKPLGSINLSFNSPSTNGQDNTANPGNNLSPITDYRIEYCIANTTKDNCINPASTGTVSNPTNWTVHPHTPLTSNSTNPLTITISNLNQANTYLFRVAAINQAGISNYSTTSHNQPSYLSLSLNTDNLTINTTPLHNNTYSSNQLTATLNTNLNTGYTLKLSTNSNNNQLTHTNSTNTFNPINSTFLNPQPLQPNTYGYRIPNTATNQQNNNISLNQFGTNINLTTNQSTHTDNYASIPTKANQQTISKYNQATLNKQLQLILATNTTKDQPAGNYTNTILFEMVGE